MSAPFAASVVVRSKDEADRLRLTLGSLARQSVAAEIVVVNDGSSDHTPAVIAEAAKHVRLVAVEHATPAGRSGATNAGAARASGDLLIFLDGDTLAAPDFVQAHLAAHAAGRGRIVRGETWHLRCTRAFLDPERGVPFASEAPSVARIPAAERARSLVTREQIAASFEAIERRAQPGIYPGAGPRRLYELEMRALATADAADVAWAAAAGSNQSVERAAFLDAGGFNEALTLNEHRELALRLCANGLRMARCSARTYHLIHRSGWRDPLADADWEAVFYAAHPLPAVALLRVLWASIGGVAGVPDHARIESLAELATAAKRYAGVHGAQAVRDAHARYASSPVARTALA